MLKLLSRFWWALILRGIIAILFGLVLLKWPALTLTVLVLLFGAYAFIDGTILILHAISGWEYRPWILLLEGVVGVALGVLTYEAPGVTALVLLLYIAIRSIASGCLEIMAGISLRKEIKGEAWLILGGVASMLFGVLLIAVPAAGLWVAVWLMAVYAIVFGVLLITLALKLRRATRHLKPAIV